MKAKHIIALFLVASPVCLIGEASALEGEPQAVTRAEKQEGCENLCLSCGDDQFCKALFVGCCKYNGGIPYGECGCRTEM